MRSSSLREAGRGGIADLDTRGYICARGECSAKGLEVAEASAREVHLDGAPCRCCILETHVPFVI